MRQVGISYRVLSELSLASLPSGNNGRTPTSLDLTCISDDPLLFIVSIPFHCTPVFFLEDISVVALCVVPGVK